jgi:integrase
MPKRSFKYVHRQITRHGRVVFYFRRRPGEPRIRLRAPYGSQEFELEYASALAGKPLSEAPRAAQGTLGAAIEAYRTSVAWSDLSAGTQKARNLVYRDVIRTAGNARLSAITSAHIVRGIDERSRRSASAGDHFLAAMRALFAWAMSRKLVASNPCKGLKSDYKPGGYVQWTDEDVERFRSHWQIGSRERLLFEILISTGLRVGDSARVGPDHVRAGVLRVTTQKGKLPVSIAIDEDLAAVIAASPIGRETFLARHDGKPFAVNVATDFFGEACKSAGIEKRAHGLRKAGASRDAEAGYSDHELQAKYAWKSSKMSSLYTKAASREKLSLGAAARVKGSAPAL